MLYDDTIAAIATPAGEGGIGIVRISGADALPILQQIFAPVHPGAWRPFRMRYGHVFDANGAPIDEGLAVFMRGPHSFTAEDVAEISCHGGPLVLQSVFERVLATGARVAEAGEFTMRAFLNGRIDLSQAEATMDVITARTRTSLALAQSQLSGWLAGEVRRLREVLLGPLAYCTVLVDFPEDEVDAQEYRAPIEAALADLERLLATADQGMIYRQGARAVLVGLPNAGKSSLLNALLRVDRAIVTPIAGTTRDTLEETANLQGIPVVLVDTAGMTETADPIERIGVERSRVALAQADLVLFVHDSTLPFSQDEQAIAALAADKPLIFVQNKSDLPASQLAAVDQPTPPRACVAVSAHTGAGLEQLSQAVAEVLLGRVAEPDPRSVSNPRHRDALLRAAGHLREALAAHDAGVPADLLAVDLTATLGALGEISGDALGDDLLHAIFSRFCIGK